MSILNMSIKTSLAFCVGVVMGVTGHIVWLGSLSSATASGVLRYEPPMSPAASASYPAGFFVESRVYLATASSDMVGRLVTASGGLTVAIDPDAPSYPKVMNFGLTVLK